MIDAAPAFPAAAPLDGLDGKAVSRRRAASGSEFNRAAHGLRGIASLMVFWAHLLGGTAKHIYQDDPSYGAFIDGMWNFGRYGVELFFVISGFVILPSVLRYAPGEFALRRLFRLYPLFFVLTLLFVALNAKTNLYPQLDNARAVIAGLFFANLFTGTEQITPNAWSLTFEVFFYTLTCLTVLCVYRRPNLTGALLTIAASLAFLGFYPITAFFLFGLIIRVAYDRGLLLRPAIARPLELVAAAACVRYASLSWSAYTPADLANPLTWKIMAATASFFYLAVSPSSLTSRILGIREILYLGTISYSLYLVHPYTYYACRQLFKAMGWFTQDQFGSMLAFFFVLTPTTLVVTHIVHHFVEMKPYQWFFHQRIYRRRPRA